MSAARLQSLLALSDEELLTILDSDPLAVITGDEDARPEVRILLQLLAEPEETVGATTLRSWLRAGDPSPLQRLLGRDFGGFEDALAQLNERGFVIRGRGASRPAKNP